jgi:hypothetical protein
MRVYQFHHLGRHVCVIVRDAFWPTHANWIYHPRILSTIKTKFLVDTPRRGTYSASRCDADAIMRERIKSLYERAPWGKSNFPGVVGATLILLSCIVPWFYSEFPSSRRYFPGGEIALNLFSGTEPVPSFASLCIYFIVAVALYMLLSKGAVLARILSLVGLALYVFSLVILPVPLAQVWAGAWMAGAGLLLIAASPHMR